MIYCNLSDDSRRTELEIKGTGTDIRDELAAIFTELKKTDIGQSLIYAALVQCADPEWVETYSTEIRQFPANRRNKA